MRDAGEAQAWKRLGSRNERAQLSSFPLGDETHDFSAPWIVIGGRNGAGKSRVLRSLAETLGERGLFLDLHHLSEQAMILLRSRTDIEDMADEAGLFEPDEERLEDLERIVNRSYSSVEWSQLDLIPSEAAVAETFKWGSDQPTVPYFRVGHRGVTYSGRDMGLGEFTVHLLMWIIEQYSSEAELTLLLDEPDAFLPPVGVQRLLRRLLIICAKRGWQLILTTHAEEMIRASVDRDAFVLLYVDDAGQTRAIPSRDDHRIASSLLARPPIEHVLFCEDESAYNLIQSMLRKSDALVYDSIATAWGKGAGDMRKLREALPKPSRFGVRFVFVFDGDQWDQFEAEPGRWPSRFLPTELDPDTLFREAIDVDLLSERVGESRSTIRAFLSGIDGDENHDWVNHLADRFGRVPTLAALADSWVERNAEHAREFAEQLASEAEFLLHSTQQAIKEAREEEAARKKYADGSADQA